MRAGALAVAAVLVLAFAASARALPGDPQPASLTPADGAVLPVDPDGIAVSFTCPGYRSADDGAPFIYYGTADDYEVALSSSPAIASDGRLADPIVRGTARPRDSDPAVCDSTLGTVSYDTPPPQVTPGTYYWQVARTCAGCDGGFEVGEVRRFVLRSTAKPTLRAPRRAYAGYPFVVRIGLAGSGADRVELQRRAGRRWKAVGTVVPRDGDAEPIVRLPRGRQQLRAVARGAGESAAGRVRTIKVLKPGRWSTGARDDGAYRDARRSSVRVTVSGRGRRVKVVRAEVPTLCGTSPNTTTVALPPISIAPDGRFAFEGSSKGTSVRLVGRLRRRALSGTRLGVATGRCSGSIALQARRAGR